MAIDQAWSGIWSDISVNSAHGLGDRTLISEPSLQAIVRVAKPVGVVEQISS